MQQKQVSPSSVDAEHRMAADAPPARLQRIKRLDLPNKAAHFEQIDALQEQIDSLQQRIVEIKSILDNRAQNRHVASPEFIAARKKLADLNAAFKEVVERKRAHREELELIKEKLRGSGSRSGLPEVSVEELDEQIRKLEYRQIHTILPLDEEKRLIVQIERLKKSRDSLRRHDNRTEQDYGSRAELIDLIKKDEQDLNNLKTEQEHQRQVLTDIREKESALALDIPALLQEKSEAYETIKGFRDDIKKCKADFSAKEDEYWKREKEWRAQQALERKMRAEKGRAEWLEREKVRKQRALENFVEPYTNEIIMCEQLLSYMLKNVPLDEGAATPQQQQKAEIIAPKGFGVALVSKKDRDGVELDGWFAGSGSKKGKKVKGSATSKSKVREKISLSLDALSSFGNLKISPPITYGDVNKSIEELKLKKDQFLEMQKVERELRERGANGGSYVVDGRDEAVSEPSGEEASSSECRAQVVDSSSCANNVTTNDNDGNDHVIVVDDGNLCTERVDIECNLQQNVPEDILTTKFVEDASDSKDNTQLDDKAHLETFEFSEAHLHTEEDAHIEEQAAENGVASVIFDCTTQNGALKELSGENLTVKEPLVQLIENGDYSHAPECEAVNNMAVTIDKKPGTHEDSQNVVTNTENGMREGSNGVLQVDENSSDSDVLECKESPLVEDRVTDPREGKVLQNGVSEDRSPLLAACEN